MNGIGRDFLQAKQLRGFLTIDLYEQINGCLSIPFVKLYNFFIILSSIVYSINLAQSLIQC